MKINLKSTLINITEKEKATDKTIANKEKNKITYQIGDEKFIIKTISPNRLIQSRTNKELECTIVFEKNKKTLATYMLKKEGYTIEIEIKTTLLEIHDNLIEIKYTVIDSNADYEYKIEMSE